MAKVTAVKCDACDHIDVPKDGNEVPDSWLLADIYQESEGEILNGKMYCSWACLADVAQHKANPPAKKRRRRTRAEMEADEAAKVSYEAQAGA